MKNKGITLIALVITIIILLILAGVTIATLTGEDGILKKASTAKEENRKGQVLEELRLKILTIQTEQEGKATLQVIVNELKKDKENTYIISLMPIENDSDSIQEVTELPENCPEIYVVYKKYQFKIEANLLVTLIGENNNENVERQSLYTKKGLRCYLDATLEETKKENQWIDISDNKNNAILHGCQWNENGLYFDGMDDYADLGYQDFGNYTLEVIFETQTLGKRKKILGNVETGGYSIDIGENDQLISYAYMNNEYKTLIDKTENVKVNTKYKMTASYNGKEYKLYRNGELVASSTVEDGLLELPDRKTIMAIRS